MRLDVLILVIAILISLFLGLPAKQIAQYFNLMDVPGSAEHKKHERPTPLAGGILIALVLGLSLIFVPQLHEKKTLITFLGASIILIFGFLDDRHGLAPSKKLIGQVLAFVILVISGIQVHIFGKLPVSETFPESIIFLLDISVTFLWIVGITNAFNMVDSMDGLVSGLSVILSTFFFVATILSNQPELVIFSAVMLGIGIGLYYWNASPAHFFLGDSGAQTIGFLLATLGILYNPLGLKQGSSWFMPIMLMSVPIFDTTMVVMSRLRRGQRIGKGRLDHTYHRLLNLGFSPTRAVLTIHIVTVTVSCLAIFAISLQPLWANIVFGSALLIGLLIMIWLEIKYTEKEKDAEVN